ncbi:lipopolysaccharide transport protein LptA [Thermus arciformis]|uniref:Lipopolysaccharide transport protein LptA n=1 Tax=Thermus arciformis TaxID=482827 RepID=A0A1G7DIR6_9DEIN|nr:LptA/OstA family protein [Thermus arciformis]SDE51438.1 lipopolysaccharide transport protein LptA [Thermus arciformis]
MRRWGWLALLGLALAATNVRVIQVEGGRLSGDLRYGPWTFEGGVKGRVKDLTIEAPRATLTAPKGKTMQEAEGEREARFEGGVAVRRGRVEARGPTLVYREKTGEGELLGPARMRQEPKPGEDPVEVEGSRMTFQVDTDTSTTENALLKSGNQEGRAGFVYYEEERGLAVFADPKGVVLTRKRKDGDLRILAPEVRSLTGPKKLIATGGVRLVDGDLVTTGESLYYDDTTGEAIVLGKPAVSENKKEGFRLSGATLLHNVNRHQVRVYGKAFRLPVEDFKKLGEK